MVVVSRRLRRPTNVTLGRRSEGPENRLSWGRLVGELSEGYTDTLELSTVPPQLDHIKITIRHD